LKRLRKLAGDRNCATDAAGTSRHRRARDQAADRRKDATKVPAVEPTQAWKAGRSKLENRQPAAREQDARELLAGLGGWSTYEFRRRPSPHHMRRRAAAAARRPRAPDVRGHPGQPSESCRAEPQHSAGEVDADHPTRRTASEGRRFNCQIAGPGAQVEEEFLTSVSAPAPRAGASRDRTRRSEEIERVVARRDRIEHPAMRAGSLLIVGPPAFALRAGARAVVHRLLALPRSEQLLIEPSAFRILPAMKDARSSMLWGF